jgi:hypothetical protein
VHGAPPNRCGKMTKNFNFMNFFFFLTPTDTWFGLLLYLMSKAKNKTSLGGLHFFRLACSLN